MSGYKRMRREHQAALLKLEERCKADVEAHKAQLDREYDSLLQQLCRELERLQVMWGLVFILLLDLSYGHYVIVFRLGE